jgi:uncharacterized pyridoxamine 5'-phosphate oxidase family protein
MHKIIISFCLILAFTTNVNAQKAVFKTGSPSPRNYYTEINYEDVNGKIIIPVRIAGETYRFLFDTGAPNLISKALWEKLGTKSKKSISVSDANQKRQSMEVSNIPILTIGNVSFKNSSALIFESDNNLVFDCFNIDGIIGSNLLRKSIVQIQSKNKLLILTNDSKKLQVHKKYESKLTLVGNQSSPYVTIKLKGEHTGSETLLFDTGASGFYDLCKKHYTVFEQKNIFTVISKGTGSSSVGMYGVAEASEQYQLKTPELIINNVVFKNVITTTGDDDNSRIGSDLLNYGTVTLNFIKKGFYFEAYTADNDLNEKLLGFSPTIEKNKLVVGFVWDDLLKDKIQFGDEIIQVNNVEVQARNICYFINKESIFKERDTLNIVFKNSKGVTSKINLEKK